MNKSTMFKKAHKMAKRVHIAGDSYAVTFGAALRIVIAESKDVTFESLMKVFKKHSLKNRMDGWIRNSPNKTDFSKDIKDFEASWSKLILSEIDCRVRFCKAFAQGNVLTVRAEAKNQNMADSDKNAMLEILGLDQALAGDKVMRIRAITAKVNAM